MEKKKGFIGLGALLLGLLITSCSGAEPKKSDYGTALDIFKSLDTVRVMQIADLHWSPAIDMEKEMAYLTDLVNFVDPDIIVSTGDNCLGGSIENYNTLFNFLDGLKNSKGKPIYWTSTWGNHDRSGVYNPAYPSDLLCSFSQVSSFDYSKEYEHHALYKDPKDNVHGHGNSFISLTDGNKTIWQLYLMDSNSDHWNGSNYEYDIIHDDQVQWFSEMADYHKEKNNGTYVPSLFFAHIPVYEVGFAANEVKKGQADKTTYAWGEIRENDSSSSFAEAYDHIGVYAGYKPTAMFETAKSHGVQGMFFGHDHVNDFYAKYDGLYIGYGQKTGGGLYFDTDMMGAKVFDLKKDGVFHGEVGNDLHVYLDDYAGNHVIDPNKEVSL